MMFLQFAVWGAWAVMIAIHMQKNLNFTGLQIGLVFGTTAFGALISPIIAGWLADRLMPSQLFAALCHFLGAIPLYFAWQATSFWPLWGCVLIHAALYMPTIALTNAVAFHHMGQSESSATSACGARSAGSASRCCWGCTWVRLSGGRATALLFAAIMGIAMGLYCLTLPNTPPTKEAKNPYAFLKH